MSSLLIVSLQIGLSVGNDIRALDVHTLRSRKCISYSFKSQYCTHFHYMLLKI